MVAKVVKGIAFLRQELAKLFMKRAAEKSGIMTVPFKNKKLQLDIEDRVQEYVLNAQKQGVDLNTMSNQNLKYTVQLNEKPTPLVRFDNDDLRTLSADSPEGRQITEALLGKRKAEVVDMAGKKIKNPQNIMGGQEVETDIVTETITLIKSKKPIEGMKEANSVIGRKGKYKNLTKEQSQKILKDTEDHIFERDIPIDPEDMAQGGRIGTGLNYLLGEDDQNSRVPFKDGTKFDPKRRTILKGIGALATLPIIGKYFKWAKPLAKSNKVLTQVPINNIDGMPLWFKPLVNKVIKEGDDVTKKFATQERQIVHTTKLPNSQTDVIVTQDLGTGNVAVDIGMGKHGFSEGLHGQPVRLEYKAGEWIEPIKGKKGTKTKEEFWVEEAEFTGGHPENIKFEDVSYEKFGQHGSDFSEVEKFATGTVKKIKKASGGRVPRSMGGISDSRVGMIFGGGIYKAIIKNLAKARGVNPSEYLKVTNYKTLPSEVRNLMSAEDFAKMKAGRVEMFENWVDMAKSKKSFQQSIAEGKKTPAAPIFEHMEQSFKSPVPSGVTDKDILQGEFILKNLKTKDRKLNATGGLAGMLGE